jgi:predicted GH43/DUF377 family glycosyl hydrolase
MANNQLLASDNFATGLAAGWSLAHGMTNTCAVVGSLAQPRATSELDGQIWTGIAFPADQISECTIGNLGPAVGTQNSVLLMVRWQAGSTSGYQLLLRKDATNANLAILQRQDSGVTTQLATTSAFTFAAGDVWSLQAAGSCVSVYLNSEPVFSFIFDATYATGSPGFQCYSTQATTNATVSAWRGYNAVQPDGVWTKQGIIIPCPASSIGTTNGGIFLNTTIFQGAPLILGGPQVYYTWMCGGQNPGSNQGVYYAESTDGKNWTLYSSNPVLAVQYFPDVFLNSGTYYMYTQSSAAVGTGNMSLYTSTDRLTWTLVNSAALTPGTSGQWDQIFYSMTVVDIIGGTWYALYAGATSFASQIYKIGLATSPDGINWTKYGSNPILTSPNGGALVPSAAFVKIGGTYYMWFQGSQPGITTAIINPTEAVRYQSTDLINWTNRTKSVHHSQLFEQKGGASGQCDPNSIMNVGSQTYFYLSAGNNGAAPQNWQIELAIAPTTLANLVQHGEDGTQQVASDGFTEPAGPLPATWTTVTGLTALNIVSGNKCEPSVTSGANCAAYYSGKTSSANQYTEITIAALTASGTVAPLVRVQPGVQGFYYTPINTAGVAQGPSFGKNVSGVFSTVSANTTMTYTPQVGDVIRLAVATGSDGFPVLSLYQNSFLIYQAQDYSNQFSTGSPGILAQETASGAAQISAWAGGNAGVLPYGAGGGDLGPGYDFKFRM